MRFNRYHHLLIIALLAACTCAANYPLKITQPQEGLDTTNRFYKAYPGLEYNVRLAVIRGDYPYSFQLLEGPGGMVINATTGEISWPNPQVSPTPYDVSVRVTDSEHNSEDVTWNITVTAEGFRFIDAVSGTPAEQGGTGTIENPWKSMKDMFEGDVYESKRADSYAGEFIYWRNGTYYIDAYIEDGTRVPFVGDYKPMVWLAYPGETPVIDYEDNASHSIIFYSNSGYKVYLEGLTIRNAIDYAIQYSSVQSGPVFRRMNFDDLGPSSGADNQAFFRILAANHGNPPLFGKNMVIQECGLRDVMYGAAMKFYTSNQVLIEDNTIYNGDPGAEGIALKSDVINSTLRGNHIYNWTRHPIGGNMEANSADSWGGNEIVFNFVESHERSIDVGQNWLTADSGPLHIERNTLIGPVNFRELDDLDGPVYIDGNVLISDSGFVTFDDVESQDPAIIGDNLEGNTTDGIIGPDGMLTQDYSAYEGTYGWQTVDSCPDPYPDGMICCERFENLTEGAMQENDPTDEIDYAARPFWGTAINGTQGGIWLDSGNPGKAAVAHIGPYTDGSSYSEPKLRWDNRLNNSKEAYVKFDVRIDENLGTSVDNREVYNFKIIRITDYHDASAASSSEWHPQINLGPSSSGYSLYTWSQGGGYGEYYFSRATTQEENHLMDNEWHTLEIYMHIGEAVVSDRDDASADGIVRIWEDGSLILEDTSAPFRAIQGEGQGINSIAFIRHAKSDGAPVEGMNGHIYFDNLEVWDRMPGSEGYHDADTDEDGIVDKPEILAYIGLWKAGDIRMADLMSGLQVWK